MHFLTRAERQRTLADVRQRLKPSVAFVVAHLSFPQREPDRTRWLSRYARFATANDISPDKAQHAANTIGAQLPLLPPENDEAMLHEAGFAAVEPF